MSFQLRKENFHKYVSDSLGDRDLTGDLLLDARVREKADPTVSSFLARISRQSSCFLRLLVRIFENYDENLVVYKIQATSSM